MTTAVPSILLIDTNASEREAYAAYLKQQGYSVYGTADLQQAYGIVEQHSPQLVLCDLNVPTLSEQTILQAIQ